MACFQPWSCLFIAHAHPLSPTFSKPIISHLPWNSISSSPCATLKLLPALHLQLLASMAYSLSVQKNSSSYHSLHSLTPNTPTLAPVAFQIQLSNFCLDPSPSSSFWSTWKADLFSFWMAPAVSTPRRLSFSSLLTMAAWNWTNSRAQICWKPFFLPSWLSLLYWMFENLPFQQCAVDSFSFHLYRFHPRRYGWSDLWTDSALQTIIVRHLLLQ